MNTDMMNRPANSLIQPAPADTLRQCAAVLGLLEGVNPDEGPADPEGIGLTAVLRIIGDALTFEASRVSLKREISPDSEVSP